MPPWNPLRRDLTAYYARQHGAPVCASCGSSEVRVMRRLWHPGRVQPFGGQAMLEVTFVCGACGHTATGFSR